MTKIQYNYKMNGVESNDDDTNVIITSKFIGPISEDKTPFAIGAKQIRYDVHNKFKIIVTYNGVSQSFIFYDSIHNYQKGITVLSPYDTLMAFQCILSDVISGDMDINEFMNEYGYEDFKDANTIHHLCKKSTGKIYELGFTLDDVYNILNQISEYENDDTIEEHITELSNV